MCVHLLLAANASLCINSIYLPHHANTNAEPRALAVLQPGHEPGMFYSLCFIGCRDFKLGIQIPEVDYFPCKLAPLLTYNILAINIRSYIHTHILLP